MRFSFGLACCLLLAFPGTANVLPVPEEDIEILNKHVMKSLVQNANRDWPLLVMNNSLDPRIKVFTSEKAKVNKTFGCVYTTNYELENLRGLSNTTITKLKFVNGSYEESNESGFELAMKGSVKAASLWLELSGIAQAHCLYIIAPFVSISGSVLINRPEIELVFKGQLDNSNGLKVLSLSISAARVSFENIHVTLNGLYGLLFPLVNFLTWAVKRRMENELGHLLAIELEGFAQQFMPYDVPGISKSSLK